MKKPLLFATLLPLWLHTMAQDVNVQSLLLQELSDNMVFVEGGTFVMGAATNQIKDAESDEKPCHEVMLDDFYICRYEVTQDLWTYVMGSNPSHFRNSRLPVEEVTWDDCQRFIGKLNALTGESYRLPTEAEWEFAARGGNKSKGYKYAGSDTIDAVAWHNGNSGNSTHIVGGKLPNELGLYDMSGNVYEWCQDWKAPYSHRKEVNPKGAEEGTYRVNRGGRWCGGSRSCRTSDRSKCSPHYHFYHLGMRLAKTPQEPK